LPLRLADFVALNIQEASVFGKKGRRFRDENFEKNIFGDSNRRCYLRGFGGLFVYRQSG